MERDFRSGKDTQRLLRTHEHYINAINALLEQDSRLTFRTLQAVHLSLMIS